MSTNESKPTLVIGASENPERYSFKAVNMLKTYRHPVMALGKKIGMIGETKIQNEIKSFENSQIDTITLYLNPANQVKLYQDIIALKPKRVIFNPGTENPEFEELLDAAHIGYEEACTLVLLRTGQF